MRCSDCSAECREGEVFCRQCGMPLKKENVEIELTGEEALTGCRKSVEFPGMYEPARISLIGGLKDGQELIFRTAKYATRSGCVVRPLYLTVRIQKEAARHDGTGFPVYCAGKTSAAKSKKNAAKKPEKKKPSFWASFAAFLSFLPRTVLLTAVLFFFTERKVLELAGRIPVLALCALSLLLLLLLNASLSGVRGKKKLKYRAFAAAAAAALLLRYAPPLMGVDLEKAAVRIGVFGDELTERYSPLLRNAVSAVPEEKDAPAERKADASAVPVSPAPPSPVPDLSGVQERAAAVIPHFAERGYLNSLTDGELLHFLSLYGAATDFCSVCLFPEQISAAEAELLMQLLRIECPETFMIDFSASYLTSGFSGEVLELTLPYAMEEKEYRALYERCERAVLEAVSETDGLTREEKQMSAYRYLCAHCRYDTGTRFAGNACGALLEGKAKCDGISLAMKWLLEEMGIENVILTGRAENEDIGHAWNAVPEDGVYYHIDVTADVGVYADNGFCLYGAFRVPGNVCEARYPLGGEERDRFDLISAADYSQSFHAKNGSLVAAGTAYGGLLDAQALEVSTGTRDAIYLQFETEEDYIRFRDRLSSTVPERLSSAGICGTYSIFSLDACRVCRIEIRE